MENFKKIAYLILITVVIILSYIVYSNANINENSNVDINDKVLSEIKYIETTLVDIINDMYNLNDENYEVLANDITVDNNDSSEEQSNQEDENEEDVDNQEISSNIEYELINNSTILASEEIDWESAKQTIELIYTSIPTIILDLYEIGISSENITEFNNLLDELTININSQNKQDVMYKIADIYKYIPVFLENTNESYVDKKIIEAKLNIIISFSKLESNNWEEINIYIQKADDILYELMLKNDLEENDVNLINKLYIMINELQNTVNLQDENIFLIKYKNLVDEMENI